MSEIVNFSRGQGLSWSDVDDKNGKFECVLYGNLYTDYDTIISKIAHKSKIKGSVLSKKFDVLMPASDTTPTGLARALCIINSGISLGGDINILSPIRDNGMCIAYSLNHHKSELIKRIKGTTVRHLQKGDIEDLKIPLPINMEEQAKISEYLYKLDNLITLHQRKYFLLKMFLQKSNLLYTYAWEQRKLGDLGSVAMNKRIFKEQTTESGDVPFYKIGTFGGVADAYISNDLYDEYTKKYPHPKQGDVLISASGSIGRTVEYSGRREYFQDSNIVWLQHDDSIKNEFLKYFYEVVKWEGLEGSTIKRLYNKNILDTKILMPDTLEQTKIGAFFKKLDNLITLHQRKYFLVSINLKKKKEICFMLNSTQSTDLFCDYYAKWIKIYKEGAIRKVTLDKYLMTCEWLKRLIPTLMICELNRITYQQLINDYAELHERQTTMDFHHQLKGAILDAVDEGFIEKDPTRKAIIKGKTPRDKKIKFLNQFELHTMLTHLNLTEKITWDWFILLVAKTGMRFSEALALTPKDFDFAHQSLSISKTWNYKEQGGFLPTKNKSSVRKIEIDWQTVIQFSELLKNLPPDMPIFVKYGEKIYNSTVNGILERHCKAVNIPIISIHGLRHTHASLLLFAGVSIASVARRLGHSSITTTQKTYLHIIHELENQDVDLVMRSLSGLS